MHKSPQPQLKLKSSKPAKSIAKSTPKRPITTKKLHKKSTKALFATQHFQFSKKSGNQQSDSESTENTETDSTESDDDVSTPRNALKGPMMPELYRLSTQLDTVYGSYYKTNISQLSTISQHMVDKNGLFLRTSPPHIHLVPKYYSDKKLDHRILYMQKGDVEVFFAPISQPDDISRNHKMIDGLFEAFNFDTAVIPLCSKPKPISDYHNPFEYLDPSKMKYDVFDPEGSPEPPKIISGSFEVVESTQYAAYKAYDKEVDISLSGRLEFVSFNNLKYKASLSSSQHRRMLLIGNPTNQQLASEVNFTVLPHAPTMNARIEITLNFEPALVATAAIRASIEEQQRSFQHEVDTHNQWSAQKVKYQAYLDAIAAHPDEAHTLPEVQDPGPEPKRPLSKRVLAVIDTAQLRHFENTYDLIDVLSQADFAYLKRGFEAYYRATDASQTLGKRLTRGKTEEMNKKVKRLHEGRDSDDDSSSESESESETALRTDPRAPDEILCTPGERVNPYDSAKRSVRLQEACEDLAIATKPFISIHRLFTAIYGPVADQASNSCGRCQFDYDEFGLYDSSAHCKSPTLPSRLGLTKTKQCGKKFDWCYNPEALRFPPFDSEPTFNETITENLFKEWMALRHGLVAYEADAEKRGDSVYLDDIMKVRENVQKILQGHVKKFPTQIVRDGDVERQKANTKFKDAIQNIELSDDDGEVDQVSSSEEDDKSNDDDNKDGKGGDKPGKKSTSISKFKTSESKLFKTPPPPSAAAGGGDDDGDNGDTTPPTGSSPNASSQPSTPPQQQQPPPPPPQVNFSQEIPVHMTASPTEQYKQSKPAQYNDFRKITDKEPHNQLSATPEASEQPESADKPADQQKKD